MHFLTGMRIQAAKNILPVRWDKSKQIYFLTPSSLMFIVDTHFYSSFWTFWAIQKLEKTCEVSLQKSWWIHREEKLWEGLLGFHLIWRLVVDLPLWKIWFGQLGLLFPTYGNSHKINVQNHSWDDDIPNLWKNNPNVPNHQPVYDRRCGYPSLLCSLL